MESEEGEGEEGESTVMTVMSGRWVPPNMGWLETRMSPRLSLPFQMAACFWTQVDMLPRWTGRCGAEERISNCMELGLDRLTIGNKASI